MTKLSVVIPCYNEEERFNDGFKHYYDYFKKVKYSWEIILVDDGSHDNTLKLLKNVSKKDERIRVVSYKKNMGKGYAVKKGILDARGDYILFSDLDHSVSIESIEGFFKYFNKGYSVVIGSRRVKGSKFAKKQPLLRELLGMGFSSLVRIFIDFSIKDTTCGFKAFKKKEAMEIFNKVSIYRWVFDAELIYLCKIYKIKLYQAPITWEDVRGSKVSIKTDILDSFIGLIRIRLNDIQNKY